MTTSIAHAPDGEPLAYEPGRWNDVTTDAGVVWGIVRKVLASHRVPLGEDKAARVPKDA